MRFNRVDGTALHVVRDGAAGPVVLFTQGLGGAWFDWDAVVPALAGDFRLIRFDRPGLGWSQSEPPAGGRPAPQTAAGEAVRLAHLLDGLGLGDERVVVVAHSYGGFHAEAFARLFPERTAGLVFVDASVEPELTPRDAGTARAVTRCVVAALRFAGLNRVFGPVVRQLIVAVASEHRFEPDRVSARAVYGSSRVVAATANELTAYRDVAVELLELRCERPVPRVPVRLLVGMGYPGSGGAVRLERQHGFAALFPHAELRELHDAKHLIASDRPDAVADAVREIAAAGG